MKKRKLQNGQIKVGNTTMIPTSQVDQILARAQNAILDKTIDSMYAAILVTLHEDLGFGPERINKVIDGLMTRYERINDGTLKVPQVLEWWDKYQKGTVKAVRVGNVDGYQYRINFESAVKDVI